MLEITKARFQVKLFHVLMRLSTPANMAMLAIIGRYWQ
jgi:hypothetical protein